MLLPLDELESVRKLLRMAQVHPARDHCASPLGSPAQEDVSRACLAKTVERLMRRGWLRLRPALLRLWIVFRTEPAILHKGPVVRIAGKHDFKASGAQAAVPRTKRKSSASHSGRRGAYRPVCPADLIEVCLHLERDAAISGRCNPRGQIGGIITGDERQRKPQSWNHVAERFDLKRDIRFETRVTAAIFDEAAKRWTTHTDRGDKVRAQFCVIAHSVSCYSALNRPWYCLSLTCSIQSTTLPSSFS